MINDMGLKLSEIKEVKNMNKNPEPQKVFITDNPKV